MFPKTLDDADVLYYTPKGDFGMIYYTAGEEFDAIAYLAVCKYPNTQNEYYLFQVNERFEVIGDSPWSSIDECMRVASASHSDDIVWIGADE